MRRRAFVDMLAHKLARVVCPYGSTRRVVRGPARGMRVVIQPGIGLTYLFGTKDAAPRFFVKTVMPGMTVVDVGANKGQMALLFAALVGPRGRVVAIEPAPAEFESLVRNVRLNGLSNVRPMQVAAAERDAEMAFAYSSEHPTQGKLVDVETTYEVPGATRLAVRAITLDDILAEGVVPDVIKLDVEGAAGVVLRGARQILDEHAPAIYVELHGPAEQASVKRELIGRGYVVETLDGSRVDDPTAAWQSPLWCYSSSGIRQRIAAHG
jgi:FkbM family methyltransferase